LSEKKILNPAKKEGLKVISFSNKSNQDKRLLKKFIDFHWNHYKYDPQYIPLFDMEYTGFKLLGLKGFFDPDNLFFKHADMRFFMVLKGMEVLGRCNAFVNYNHNERWKDKIGFFGQFETVDDPEVVDMLINSSTQWLKSQGMDEIRGPQNLPVNEATPGLMTEGFDSRPVTYYHYNKSYYEKLLLDIGFKPIKQVFSWEVPVTNPMEEKLERVSRKVIDRFEVTFESWGERPLKERKLEMFEIYNEAWKDNFGFVPFTKEEFDSIVDDMQVIMDKGLFMFVYVKGESAAFFGGVPNLFEKMKPHPIFRRAEWWRMIRLFLSKKGACSGPATSTTSPWKIPFIARC
jgi:hypothetical protein